MKRPKVFYTSALTPNKIGGIEAFSAELARQLDQRGWDIVICFEGVAPAAVREFLLAPGNVTLEAMPAQSGLSAANSLEFFQLMWRHRPDTLLYSLGGVVRWWPLIAMLTGVKRRLYNDVSSRTKESIAYRAGAGVRLAMRPLQRVVCASEFVMQCSDREGITPAGKRSVLYNSVNNGRDFGDGEAFRQRYGIPADRQIVLQVSWLVPEKGIDVALLAAARALAVRPDLHFVFCGEGANYAEYEGLARTLGIAGNVTWTGQMEDLVQSGPFRAATMQMQCSQWHEACALSIVEGMSAGLPLLASRIGGNPELVADGVSGYLFEPRDDEALAEAILRLADDAGLRARMGAAGRERSLERHDLVRNVTLWVELLTA